MIAFKNFFKYFGISALFCTQLTNCQEKMEEKQSAFQVEISSPETKYRVEPVFDKIKTEEGTIATLPYGGSSGKWGSSGKGWTEQFGTPIGADVTYYSPYESVFYHLDVDFPKDKIKEYMKRAYSRVDDLKGETQEFKELGRGRKSGGGEAYDSFTTLVFGFAPKGMVVVWLNFGNTRIELDRYQAKAVMDQAEIEKAKEKYLKTYRIEQERFEEEKKLSAIPDANSKQWDDYRIRYQWRPVVSSENPNFRLFEVLNYTYNGEQETSLRPQVLNIPARERAIPREMVFFWETSKEKQDQLNARVFFNWEKTNEAFKKAGNKIDMQVKITADNTSMEIFLNNEPLETDSIRIFQWTGDYKE